MTESMTCIKYTTITVLEGNKYKKETNDHNFWTIRTFPRVSANFFVREKRGRI